MAKNYEVLAAKELNILEGLNIIPGGDIFKKEDRIKYIAEAKEAVEELDVDLDGAEDELDAHGDKLKDHKADKPKAFKGFGKAGDDEDDENAIPEIDEEDDKVAKNKAEAINKSKYSLKLLIKLYDSLLNKVSMTNSIPIGVINDSKGDIKKLGVIYRDKTYYDIFKTITDTHEVVCEGLSDGRQSKYFTIYKDFVKNVEKNTPKFKKAYTKKQENIVKSIYVAAVLYAFEMATILSSETVHIFNKSSKNFDKLLEETKDYIELFKAADAMFNDPESDVTKLLSTELSISESFNHRFLQSIDDTSKLDEDVANLIEGLNLAGGMRAKTIGLAHIAKLLKYGLSITLYKMFASLRYIIYIYNYQKFSITNKINLIKDSLELTSGEGDASNRNSVRSETTDASMRYRADSIQASNKARIDAATNDKEEFDF